MMARYREYVAAQEKRRPQAKRHQAGPGGVSRTVSEERTKIRQEYFRKSRAGRNKTSKASVRMF